LVSQVQLKFRNVCDKCAIVIIMMIALKIVMIVIFMILIILMVIMVVINGNNAALATTSPSVKIYIANGVSKYQHNNGCDY